MYLKIWYDFDQLKKTYDNFSEWVLFFACPCICGPKLYNEKMQIIFFQYLYFAARKICTWETLICGVSERFSKCVFKSS